ncbi:unnamed protein product [Prunus armeniaca]
MDLAAGVTGNGVGRTKNCRAFYELSPMLEGMGSSDKVRHGKRRPARFFWVRSRGLSWLDGATPLFEACGYRMQ